MEEKVVVVEKGEVEVVTGEEEVKVDLVMLRYGRLERDLR